MDMTEACVIEEKFLLGNGKVLVVVGQDLHIKDLSEVIRGAGGTRTIRTTGRAGRGVRGASDEVRDAVLGRDGHMESALDLLSIRDLKPHGSVVPAETGFLRTAPSVIAGKGLRRHEALFRRGNVIRRHLENTLVPFSVSDGPFHKAKTGNVNRAVDRAHLAKIARDGLHNKV
jgi:hypothetical protein